jgi:hypothetical protein
MAPPSSPVSNLSLFHNFPVCRRSSLLSGEVGGGGGGAKSSDREKAWPSINHSMLSGGVGEWGLQLGSAAMILLLCGLVFKGTVRPDWICMRVVSLESSLKRHQPLYVFNFLFLILNI